MSIRLFIGTSNIEDNWIEKNYLYSLFQNSNEDFEVTFLRPKKFPKWNTFGWGTPFTCYRHAIPEICNYKGRAIYTDVDMINFRNMKHLWDTDLCGKPFGMCWDALQDNGVKWRDTKLERGWWCDSVMVIDNEKCKGIVPSTEEIAKAKSTWKWIFMEDYLGSPRKEKGKEFVHTLNPRWNSFDGKNASVYVDGNSDLQPDFSLEEIWQLHLTSLSYQPWHPKYNPHSKANYKRKDIAEHLWKLNEKTTMIAKSHEF